MANKPANTVQRKFMSDMAEFMKECDYHVGMGSIYGPGYASADFDIHHVFGRSYKHNKTHIGHDAVIPVPKDLHDVSSNNPDNVTHFKHNFTRRFGKQTDIFSKIYFNMRMQGYNVPGKEKYLAIMDTGA